MNTTKSEHCDEKTRCSYSFRPEYTLNRTEREKSEEQWSKLEFEPLEPEEINA